MSESALDFESFEETERCLREIRNHLESCAEGQHEEMEAATSYLYIRNRIDELRERVRDEENAKKRYMRKWQDAVETCESRLLTIHEYDRMVDLLISALREMDDILAKVQLSGINCEDVCGFLRERVVNLRKALKNERPD